MRAIASPATWTRCPVVVSTVTRCRIKLRRRPPPRHHSARTTAGTVIAKRLLSQAQGRTHALVAALQGDERAGVEGQRHVGRSWLPAGAASWRGLLPARGLRAQLPPQALEIRRRDVFGAEVLDRRAPASACFWRRSASERVIKSRLARFFAQARSSAVGETLTFSNAPMHASTENELHFYRGKSGPRRG